MSKGTMIKEEDASSETIQSKLRSIPSAPSSIRLNDEKFGGLTLDKSQMEQGQSSNSRGSSIQQAAAVHLGIGPNVGRYEEDNDHDHEVDPPPLSMPPSPSHGKTPTDKGLSGPEKNTMSIPADQNRAFGKQPVLDTPNEISYGHQRQVLVLTREQFQFLQLLRSTVPNANHSLPSSLTQQQLQQQQQLLQQQQQLQQQQTSSGGDGAMSFSNFLRPVDRANVSLDLASRLRNHVRVPSAPDSKLVMESTSVHVDRAGTSAAKPHQEVVPIEPAPAAMSQAAPLHQNAQSSRMMLPTPAPLQQNVHMMPPAPAPLQQNVHMMPPPLAPLQQNAHAESSRMMPLPPAPLQQNAHDYAEFSRTMPPSPAPLQQNAHNYAESSRMMQPPSAPLQENAPNYAESSKSAANSSASSSFYSSGFSDEGEFWDDQDFSFQSQDDEDDDLEAIDGPARGPGRRAKRRRSARVPETAERHALRKRLLTLKRAIPNCDKLDEISIYDEAVEYIKSLQIRTEVITSEMISLVAKGSCMPQMIVPEIMQNVNFPSLSFGIDIGFGLGLGLGAYEMNNFPMPAPQFPFVPMPQPPNPENYPEEPEDSEDSLTSQDIELFDV